MNVGTSFTPLLPGFKCRKPQISVYFLAEITSLFFDDRIPSLWNVSNLDDPKDWNDGTIEENTDEMSTYYRSIILAGPSEKGQALLEKVNNQKREACG